MFPYEMFHCCGRKDDDATELCVVDIMSEKSSEKIPPVHSLTALHVLDVTLTPRMSGKGERPSKVIMDTARRQYLNDRISLPLLVRYPVPPGYSHDDPEEVRHCELLRIYQEFVVDLHKGMYMMNLTADQGYSDMHVQLLDDLQTLKVDQGNGCLIEFPLTAVAKVYHIIKNDNQWYSLHDNISLSSSEHVVIVEFLRKKLAFVFTELIASQRFLLCMELLIRRCQETRHEEQSTFSCRKPRAAQGLNPRKFGSSISTRAPERPAQKARYCDIDDPAAWGCEPEPATTAQRVFAHSLDLRHTSMKPCERASV
eukprot:TRINITY_DN37801_c0_g2_i1.p1 TRINITY_DN37801_c0_g2~~TRINITY_DN37801_c0_g2_i1.p1  ORF type:complete len:312 (-),score=56.53 TRINITY_DN37801_c0_g2_i1:113-1048(-)